MGKKAMGIFLAVLMLFITIPAAAAENTPDVTVNYETGAVTITASGTAGDSAGIKIEKDGKCYYLDSAYLGQNGTYTFQTVLPLGMEFAALLNVAGQETAFTISTVKPGDEGSSSGGSSGGSILKVSLSIDLKTISGGYILSPSSVKIEKGDTVWDVLKRELDKRDIPYEYNFNEQYDSVYVESINNVGEFDNGPGSGWMYNVNGKYPNYGCSRYTLKGGETIQWRYTTNYGKDLGAGNDFSGNGGNSSGGNSGVTVPPTTDPTKPGENPDENTGSAPFTDVSEHWAGKRDCVCL